MKPLLEETIVRRYLKKVGGKLTSRSLLEDLSFCSEVEENPTGKTKYCDII